MINVHTYTSDKLDQVLGLEVCQREVDELKALGFEDTKETLRVSLESSHYAWYATYEDGKVCGAGGVTLDPTEEGMGLIWLLVDELSFKKYMFSYNSWTQDLLKICFEDLGLYCIHNYVSLNNKASVKWLKYMGFEFMLKYRTFKDPNVVFDEFYMYKEDY